MALAVHNFLSHLHFLKMGEIMLLKYGNLILPEGHILDLYCARLSSAAHFYETYTRLYFDAKQLEKALIEAWGWGLLVPFFQKKCHFWQISNVAVNF